MRESFSMLLYLSDDVWRIILQFLTNNELYQLKFLCWRFYMIISFSPFCKNLDYYREIGHDVVDPDKLYECFIDLYDNFFFINCLKNFSRCYLEPVKNYFLCSNVSFHLLNCPRSNYAVNDCSVCSRLYIDPLVYPDQKVDLRNNTDLRYKLIKSSIFAYDCLKIIL